MAKRFVAHPFRHWYVVRVRSGRPTRRRCIFASLAYGLSVGTLGLSTPHVAHAIELGSEGDLASVEIHGFASQGFILSTHNNYLSANTTSGSFQYSEIGLNFTKSLTDNLRLGLQLFAQDLGPSGSFDPKVDWFYLDYRWRDWLGFRAGRVKIPFGLYNEVNDVDAARVPILLPQSVYPIENTNFLLAQTGAELYGYLRLHAAGALEYRVYGGTILLNDLIPPSTTYQVQDLNAPYVVGGRLVWETPIDGLRLAGSGQALRIDATLAAKSESVSVQIPAELWVASAEYAAHDLVVTAEYSRWYTQIKSNNASLFPSSTLKTSERGYLMASYRVAKWLQPSMYYALEFPNVADRSGGPNVQHDVATTLRFDINSHWLVKLEGHYMAGTAEVDASINGNAPLGSLAQSWEVFLAKTTAYF
jgi:hypothetical protein